MSEAGNLFTALRQSADPVAGGHRAAGRERRTASSAASTRSTSPPNGLDEERVIAAFLHAARLGLFELSWNVLCPGCGGVLDTGTTLKTVHRERVYLRALRRRLRADARRDRRGDLHGQPRVRRIAAHEPDELPFAEYFRQIFWGSGIDLPDNIER